MAAFLLDRWETTGWSDEYDCPICGNRFSIDDIYTWNYCPRCGHRLRPPIEEDDD